MRCPWLKGELHSMFLFVLYHCICNILKLFDSLCINADHISFSLVILNTVYYIYIIL